MLVSIFNSVVTDVFKNTFPRGHINSELFEVCGHHFLNVRFTALPLSEQERGIRENDVAFHRFNIDLGSDFDGVRMPEKVRLTLGFGGLKCKSVKQPLELKKVKFRATNSRPLLANKALCRYIRNLRSEYVKEGLAGNLYGDVTEKWSAMDLAMAQHGGTFDVYDNNMKQLERSRYVSQ